MDAICDRLAVEAAAGNEGALVDICSRIRPIAFTTALRALHDPDQARDVESEVIKKVVTHLRQYRPARGHLGSWVYRIIENEVAALRRRLRHEPMLADEDEAEELAGPADTEAECRQHIREEWLGRAMPRLPYLLRQAVDLCYCRGLSHCAAARLAGVSEHTIRERLEHAYRLLLLDLSSFGPGRILLCEPPGAHRAAGQTPRGGESNG
jgi:RNA polymerase sigma factor (sigma-70 family)